ncbi:MAG: carbohydrate porin [Deltaproteobacteria bacterium]|nr:carbohydrate porin [Deltaproteobacteria bacterium]
MTNDKRSTRTPRKLEHLIKSRLTAALPLVHYRPTMWATICLFFSLGFLTPTFAQTAIGASDPVHEEVGIQEDASEGILPVPDYSGDWRTRPFLTGNWGGKRQELADKGLTFDVEWLQVGQGVVSGGRNERWAYGTSLDYYINLDLMRMGVLPGALISFRGQSRFGSTVNQDTGLLQPVNTYSFFPLTTPSNEDVPIAITELNYLQFFSDKVGLLLGKITTMGNADEFSGGEGRSQFMNFQLIYPAVFAQVAPYSTLAVGGLWLPSPKVTVTTLLMNTKDSSTTSGFNDIGEGTSWWTSVDTQHRLGSLPGGMTLGVVYAFDGDFARIGGLNIDPGDGISLERKSEAWAVYWNVWQYLFTEGEPPEIIDPTDGRQDLEGLGVFATLGLGDKDTNPVSWSAAGGLSGRGLIPGRSDDTCGLGYFYNSIQDPRSIALNRLAKSTQGLELYYNVAITKSVALTLNGQWTRSAVRRFDDSIVLGSRLNISF